MSERRDRALMRQAIDTTLSGLREDPWLAMRVLARSRQGTGAKGRPRLTAAAVAGVLLMAGTVMAAILPRMLGSEQPIGPEATLSQPLKPVVVPAAEGTQTPTAEPTEMPTPTAAPQLTEAERQAWLHAQDRLTKVYGYTEAEAARFGCRFEHNDGELTVLYYPQAHPAWAYSEVWTQGQWDTARSASPFRGTEDADGSAEACVRETLRQAAEQQWLIHWNPGAMTSFHALLENDPRIPASEELTLGLASGAITAKEAVTALFRACYGTEEGWSSALREWHDEALALTAEPAGASGDLTEEIIHNAGYEAPGDEAWSTMAWTETLPEALLEALAASPFAEDEVLQGALAIRQADGEMNECSGQALAAVRREGRVMLIGFSRISGEWQCEPVSETLLRTDEDFAITVDRETDGLLSFGIRYDEDALCLRYTAGGTWQLWRYEQRGEGFSAELSAGTIVISSGGASEGRSCYTSLLAEDIDGDSFPTTLEELRRYVEARQLLGMSGMAVCSGANLRVRPTTDSESLAMLNDGVIMRDISVFASERKDSDMTWHYVIVGNQTGFVSDAYVHDPVAMINGEPLPVCRVTENTQLYEATVAEAEALMALGVEVTDGNAKEREGAVYTATSEDVLTVLGESKDGWLLVFKPNTPQAFPMRPDGVYGWVHKKNAVCEATPLRLKYQR